MPDDDVDDGDPEDFEDLGDGECFVALSSRTATGASISAAVERWLRMPHHYSLREYLSEHKAMNHPSAVAVPQKGEHNDD